MASHTDKDARFRDNLRPSRGVFSHDPHATKQWLKRGPDTAMGQHAKSSWHGSVSKDASERLLDVSFCYCITCAAHAKLAAI